MGLQEGEWRRNKRDRDQRRRQELSQLDDRVLTFPQWCELNGFSVPTGQRIRNAGNGPKFVQLSPRRIGVTVGENRRWQQSRARE